LLTLVLRNSGALPPAAHTGTAGNTVEIVAQNYALPLWLRLARNLDKPGLI
jgi:hypothetical protein